MGTAIWPVVARAYHSGMFSVTANEVLGAMITPALLISAAGTLVLSTSNRLGRVVDRVRVLADMAEALHPPNGEPDDLDEKRDLIHHQLAKLTARILILVPAITTLYTAIGLLVATSISAGVIALFGWSFAWAPVVPGLCGAALLFHASVLLVREARLAVDSTLHEMSYVRRVVARKTGLGDVKRPL